MKNFLLGLGAWFLVVLFFTGVILGPTILLCVYTYEAIVAGCWGLAAFLVSVIGLIIWVFVMDWQESNGET